MVGSPDLNGGRISMTDLGFHSVSETLVTQIAQAEGCDMEAARQLAADYLHAKGEIRAEELGIRPAEEEPPQ